MKYLHKSFSMAMGRYHTWSNGTESGVCVECGITWTELQAAKTAEFNRLRWCQGPPETEAEVGETAGEEPPSDEASQTLQDEGCRTPPAS